MHTEITDTAVHRNPAGWVCYDGNCPYCRGIARWLAPVLARRDLEVVPLQTRWVATHLNLNAEEPPREMVFLTEAGEAFGGAAGVLAIARRYRWAAWLWWLGRVPMFMACFDAAYRWIAKRRSCANGECALPGKAGRRFEVLDLAFVTLLPVLVGLATWNLPAWAFMWALAAALALGLKWLTWRREYPMASLVRTLGWFCAWPGMDAKAFFAPKQIAEPAPAHREWSFATAKLLLGVVLVWGATRQAVHLSPTLAAWIGIIGIIFCLHFGLFHILSLIWRACGVNAQPIMRAPVLATSLAEFWGERWNTAFSIPARRLALIPLGRRIGAPAATLAVFFISGLLHEVVISLPARGGCGLPTAYFTLQAMGILFERSMFGLRLGLGRGWRGWLFMLLLTAGPAYWLFHPPFARNVILPMLQGMGAT